MRSPSDAEGGAVPRGGADVGGADVGGAMLIFDGDCGFCTAVSNWVATRWEGVPGGSPSPRIVPWQFLAPSELEALGLTAEDVATAAWWVDESGRPYRGSAAVARALGRGHRIDRVAGALLRVPPVSWLALPGYWLVARYRYLLPGSTPACRVTSANSSASDGPRDRG